MPTTNGPSEDADLPTGTRQPTAREIGATAAPAQMTYRGTLIKVTAKRNSRGAWIPDIAATCDGVPVALNETEPVTPEWLTEVEAVRAGIEQGRFLVDRSLASPEAGDAE